MKNIGTFYEAPSAKLLDKTSRVIGECLDTPNAIAYAMSQDERVAKVKTLMGYRHRADYADRFWFVVKEFTPVTAYWTKF